MVEPLIVRPLGYGLRIFDKIVEFPDLHVLRSKTLLKYLNHPTFCDTIKEKISYPINKFKYNDLLWYLHCTQCTSALPLYKD